MMVAVFSRSCASAMRGAKASVAAAPAACSRVRRRSGGIRFMDGLLEMASMRRVRARHRFVDVGAPARACGQLEMAIGDGEGMRQQLAAPRHFVLVELEDAEVRDGGAEMRAHERAERSVRVVRG